jgi:hypothetical protein
MALQQTATLSSLGLTLENVYYRVENLAIDSSYTPATEINPEVPRNSRMTFYVRAYATSTNVEKLDQTSYNAPYDIQSLDNPIKQAYIYVKTMPEFENAVDI